MIALLVGLRGFALVLVLAGELASADLLPSEFGAGFDQIGLMIFAVSLGFTLALRYGHEPIDRADVVEFAATRARRLLPAYYAAVIASLAIQGWWRDWPFRFHSVADVLQAIFLIDAPGVLWLVPALAQCCVLFVVAWWMWSRGWSPWVLAALPVLIAVIPGLLGWLPPSGHALSAVVPCFFVGVAAGLAWPATLEPLLVQHLEVVSLVGGLAFFFVCINMPAVRASHGWVFGHSVLASTWFDPLSVILVVALVIVTATRPIALAVLGVVPLLVLGRFWYAGYLVAPVLIAAVS